MEYGIHCEATSNVSNNVISGNDLSGLTTSIAQVYLPANTHTNYFGPWPDPNGHTYSGNVLGPLQLTYNLSVPPTDPNYGKLLTLGAHVDNGTNNICQHNDFTKCKLFDQYGILTNYLPGGYVPGWYATPAIGCILLSGGDPTKIPPVPPSSDAQIYEHPQLGTKYFPDGTSMCNQIANLGSNNYVHQWENFCANPPNPNIDEIQERWAVHQAWQEKLVSQPPPDVTWPEYQDMTPGYIWNEETHQWELPEH
jgi:hypothetical protein